jgi:hypothetical protein
MRYIIRKMIKAEIKQEPLINRAESAFVLNNFSKLTLLGAFFKLLPLGCNAV